MYENNAFQPDRDQQLEAMMNAGQLAEALALLEQWYEREPWNGDVLVRMAVVHWLAGEPARTLRDLDAYLAQDPDNAEVLARRAQALLMLGKHEDAEDSLARAEALDPNTPGVRLNRALIEEEHGELDRAIASLSAYLELIPADHLALARRSHLYRQLGQYPQALQDALACVRMQPDDPEAHFAEALARVTLEQGEEGLAACDQALALKPEFFPALRLKIDMLADLGRLNEAEDGLAQLLAADPGSPHTMLLRARMAAERGEYPDALEWINHYLDDNPDEAYGYYRRGMVLYRMGQLESALADFQEYARLAPRALEAYEQQYLCYLELGRLPEAEKVGAAALAIQPSSVRLQYNYALAQLLNGHIAEGKRGLLAAFSLDPENEELLLRIHFALTEYATPALRQEWLQEAANALPNGTTMLKGLLAEGYLEQGQFVEALILAREVLAEDNQRPFGYLLGIKALCLLDKYAEAEQLADAGVAALPEEGRLRLARALVLRDTGRSEAALRELEVAGRMLPGDAEVVRQQALVYGSIGQIGEAVHLLQQAVTLDPESVESFFWLGYFSLHRKRYRDALDAAERAVALSPSATEGRLLRALALFGLKRRRDANKELDRVQRENPALLARFNTDPMVTDLLREPRENSLGKRMRRSLSGYWHIIAQTVRYGH